MLEWGDFMERIRRRPFVPYQEALTGFAAARKELNDCREDRHAFLEKFEEYKQRARREDAVAMDVLAYYYKSGVPGVLSENYMRYIAWEFVASARGNELAIEKLQFLIGYACDEIIAHEKYDTIKYKNDIDDYNTLYVLCKGLCKIIVREFLKAYPVDLVKLEDDFQPFEQKYFVTLRRYIDESIPKTIEYFLS